LVTVILKETTMKMWKVFRGHSVIALGLLATVFVFASLANATLLAPNGSTGALGSTLNPVTGPVLVSVVNEAYNLGGGDTGTVSEWVVADANNTFGAGDLDFIYQVTVTGPPTVSDIGRLTGSSYGSQTTDVYDGGWAGTVPGTVAPINATNTGTGGVAFNFSPTIKGGSTSYQLIVETSVTGYVAGSIGLLDTNGGTVAGYAPSPEPGSVGLLLGGLFGLGLFVTRRFRVQQS
jgi:hypothetical protein